MAPSTHCIVSALPWQYAGYVSASSIRWTLNVCSVLSDPANLARVDLYFHERTERYEWLIINPKRLTIAMGSTGPGWKRYETAEQHLLRGLSQFLAEMCNLPTSLPARAGTIFSDR